MTRIAVVGGGKMGEALLAGIAANAGQTGGSDVQVCVVESDEARAAELTARYSIDAVDLSQATAESDVLVLAVKPHQLVALGRAVGSSLGSQQTVVSVAAGASLEVLAKIFGDQVQLVRAMPNTPALVGKGVTGLSFGDGIAPESKQLVTQVLEAIGSVVEIPESQQDALTAVSGSGPAYVFAFVEALAAGGVGQGLDADTATALARQTVIGAAAMLDQTTDSATTLRENVTSPNGTTQAALESLAASGLVQAVAQAAQAAAVRSAEMTDELLTQLDD